MIGKFIKSYRIHKLIGEGGMANVYEAFENEALGTTVAIKVLHPQYAYDPIFKGRFEKEANSLAQLHHANIVKIRDYYKSEGLLAIIMEHVRGKNLQEVIRDHGAMTVDQVIQIFIQALDALSYVHKKKVIHRDIKPSNILLSQENNVKISDFGIAKMIGDEDLFKTKTGTKMGSPAYMSPEQIRTPQAVDHRTDIYSLGLSLYVALTARLPFDPNLPEFDIMEQIVRKDLPKISSAPSGINRILKVATAKAPEKRYQSADAFKLALQKYYISSQADANKEEWTLAEIAGKLKHVKIKGPDKEQLNINMENVGQKARELGDKTGKLIEDVLEKRMNIKIPKKSLFNRIKNPFNKKDKPGDQDSTNPDQTKIF